MLPSSGVFVTKSMNRFLYFIDRILLFIRSCLLWIGVIHKSRNAAGYLFVEFFEIFNAGVLDNDIEILFQLPQLFNKIINIYKISVTYRLFRKILGSYLGGWGYFV